MDSLLVASRALIAVSARSLAEIEHHLTLPQFRTMVIIDSRGPINLTTLAVLLHVNASTAMRMIDRLLALEMVTRRDNPHNRREVVLGLTGRGSRVVRRVVTKRREEIRLIAARMPAEDRAAMIAALDSFTRAAGELPELASTDSYPHVGW